MREIGGYFELETFGGREYYPELIALNSARNALLYLLRARGIQRLWIPGYLCGSVAQVCAQNGVEVSYYHVGRDFRPDLDRTPGKGERLLLVNYFGQLDGACVQTLREKYKAIILDNTQAFFQRPLPGVDTFYSCRKYFGVPDGSYLSTEARLDGALKADLSAGRMAHILGRFEKTAEEYYPRYRENEDGFEGRELRAMSALTKNLLGPVDYGRVKARREENFALLHGRLKAQNPLALTAPEGPFAYPFYSGDAPALRRRLAEEKIYVPLLWPDGLDTGDETERDLMEHILPLPCDQRYGRTDMERILNALGTE